MFCVLFSYRYTDIMKAITLLFILASSEALYPPPNYISIVRPSSTYFKPDNGQTEQTQSSLPPKVPTYTKPPSHFYFTPSTSVQSVSTSTQAPSHSYHNPSSSAFSGTSPSPILSTSYGYTIPNVTPASQHHLSSVVPIIQQQTTNSAHFPTSYISSSAVSPTTNSAPTSEHYPPTSINYQYKIPVNSSETVASVSDSNTITIPSSQHGFNTYYATIVPTVVTAENQTAAVHTSHPAYNVPHVSSTTASEYKKFDAKSQNAVNLPVKTKYEYTIPTFSSVSTTPPTSQIVHSAIPQYDASHVHSNAFVDGYEVSHLGQPQGVKSDYKYVVTSNSPTSISLISSSNVNAPTVPAAKSDISHIEHHYSTVSPPVQTYYEYNINKNTISSNGPKQAGATTTATEHNVHHISEELVSHYGVPHVGQQQTANPIIKTKYEYVVSHSTPTPTGPSSADRIAAIPSSAPEHYGYHRYDAAGGADHAKQSQSTNPLIKTSYEYVIPGNSPSTVAPVLKYDYLQSHKISTPQYSVPSINIASVPANGFGCVIPQQQQQYQQQQQQQMSPSVTYNPMLATVTPSGLSPVHQQFQQNYVTHVQPTISPPVITNYEYVIPVLASAPVSSVSIPGHEGLHIPSSEYGTSQQHITSPPTQSNNQYVVLQTITSSKPSVLVSNIPHVLNAEYGVPNKPETPIEVKVPIQTSYEYNIPNQHVPVNTTHLNGAVVSVPTASHETPTTSHSATSTFNFPNTEAQTETNIPIQTSYEYGIPTQSLFISPFQEYGAPVVTSQHVVSPVQVTSVPTLEHGSLHIPTSSSVYTHLNNQPVHTNNNQYIIPQLTPQPTVTSSKPTSNIPGTPSTEYGAPNKAETLVEMKKPIQTSYEYNIQSQSQLTGQSEQHGAPAVFSHSSILPALITSAPILHHSDLHLSEQGSLQTNKPIDANNQAFPGTTFSNPTSSIPEVPSTEHEVQSITKAPVEVINVPIESSYEYSIPTQTVSNLPQDHSTPTVSTPPIILLQSEYGVPH